MLSPERHAALVLSLEACDPKRLIRDALGDAGSAVPGGWSARDLYLAWLLDLPMEVDAAHAAALLLSRIGPPPATDRAVQDLLALLRTTTAYPRERLEPAPVTRSQLH